MKKRAECQDKRPTLRAFLGMGVTRKETGVAREENTRARVLIWLSLLLLSTSGACSLQRVVGFVSYFHTSSTKIPDGNNSIETRTIWSYCFRGS